MLYHGFNVQWMFSWESGKRPAGPDERALDFMAECGFNFVRAPIDCRFLAHDLACFLPDRSMWKKVYTTLQARRNSAFYLYNRALERLASVGLVDIPVEDRLWTRDFIYLRSNEMANCQYIDRYVEACSARGLHLCLNLHRAPGYCINEKHLERYNLWRHATAQDIFVSIWEAFAQRYKGIPKDALSFNLLNEPPSVGQHGLTRDNHAALIRRTVAAIRRIDPTRAIVIDGLDAGQATIPELSDLDVTHSGRGYEPRNLTHYEARWWPGYRGQPVPEYPGTQFAGKIWDKDTLARLYQPWRDVEAQGVKVHIGEFGCYNKTPNDVARRWFADLVSIYRDFGWGYSLWEFEGPFGVVSHGRPGSTYETVKGYVVDRELLELLMNIG
jgi:endoglucanase